MHVCMYAVRGVLHAWHFGWGVHVNRLEACSSPGSCNVPDESILSMTLHVDLPSGRRVSLHTCLDIDIENVKSNKRTALRQWARADLCTSVEWISVG